MGLMPTPTFPEQPLKSNELELTPTDALAAIGRGDFAWQNLAPLSDLSRTDADLVRKTWPTIDQDLRERAVIGMAELAENDVRYQFGRALRVALGDPEATIRQRAVAALWEDDSLDLVDDLVDLAEHDTSQDVRAEAAQGLGRFADRAAAEELSSDDTERIRSVLIDLASDPSSPYIVRRRSLESAAVFGADEDVISLIRNAYEADDAGMRAASIYAMGRSLDLGWLEVVLHEFESPDAEMRFESARASGELGSERAVLGLIQLASDVDAEVRQAAIGALGKIGGPAAVQALRRLAKIAAPADADAIEDALEEASIASDVVRMRS